MAGTVYDSGDDRYTLLNGDIEESDTDPTWEANVQLNLTVPEEIGTRSELDGTIRYNMTQSGNNLSSVSPALYANTTIDVQGESVNTSVGLEFQENDTEYMKDIIVDLGDADLNESGDTNDTLTATFETESNTDGSGSDQSTSDSISLEVKLVEHISYMLDNMVTLIIAIIPLIVVLWVLKFIFGMFDDLGDQFG